MCEVNALMPSFPIGSSAAPARTSPSITTDGLEKFSFTSTVMPLGYVCRTMLCEPGMASLSKGMDSSLGQVVAQHAIAAPQVFLPHALHIFHGHRRQPI